jgi:ABC-type multidrug transport system ATPase subunit
MIEAVCLGACSRDGALWEELTFAVGGGEILIVTGPPSCGKTVLLGILRGDRAPDSGDVLVGGKSLYRDAREAAAFRARAGFVPECPPAPRGRTVAHLFDLSTLAGGLTPAEGREREAGLLALVGMPDARDCPLPSLSCSERVRVFLAAELLHGPRYLFADGVVSAAGEEWGPAMGSLFRALAREGAAVVLAERTVPARFPAAEASEKALGPFRLFRLGPGGEGKR